MLLAHQNQPSLWASLLWKDFQQVKLAFLVLVGGALCMQLLFLAIVWAMLDLDQWGPFVNSVFGFASVTPVLLALGCSGMLIGHERQSGSWAWSSSLPVSWWQALGSKLIVATLGSLIVSLPLGIIPTFLSTILKTRPTIEDISGSYYVLTLVIFLQVIVACFLATVLMRETLGALITAGLILTVLHIFSSLPLWHNNSWATWFTNRFGISSDSVPAFWFLFLSSSILAIGFGLLTAAFRWRWTYGQQSKFAFWQERGSTAITGEFHNLVSTVARPNQWWMMFVHSLRNNLAIGLCILATYSVCMLAYVKSDELTQLFFALAVIALGVIGFQSDQTTGRFRFLADRGVAPWKLVISRLSIPFGLTVLVFFVYFIANMVSIGEFSRPEIGFFTGPISFSLGALASICFRKQVIAIGIAIFVAVLGSAINWTLLSWVENDQQRLMQFYGNSFEKILLCYLPVGGLIYLVSLFWFARRWLVLDKPNLEMHFLWVSALALLTPFCFACTFGFLAIRYVPEVASPIELNSSSEPMARDLFSLTDPLLVGNLPELSLLSRYQSGTMHMIAASAQSASGTVRNELKEIGDQPISELINPLLSKLDASRNEARVPVSRELQNQLDRLIVRTAALASIALNAKEGDLGLRLWKLNRELQDIGSEVNPLNTQAARKTAMYLLLDLKSEDIQLIGGPEIYRTLIPAPADERSWSIEYSLASERNNLGKLQRMSNSAITPMHWYAITRYYPPLRWLYERQLVSDERRHRAAISTLRKNYITDVVRRQLVQRFPE